jgi:hypothetical protein
VPLADKPRQIAALTGVHKHHRRGAIPLLVQVSGCGHPRLLMTEGTLLWISLLSY